MSNFLTSCNSELKRNLFGMLTTLWLWFSLPNTQTDKSVSLNVSAPPAVAPEPGNCFLS